MNELDKQIEYWKRIYLDTYAQGPRKFEKCMAVHDYT